MIPATQPVTAYDPASGKPLVYDQWVPTEIVISSPDDFGDDPATPTAVLVTLCRCRTLASGKTDRLPEATARAVGATRTVQMQIPNIYAPPTDGDEDEDPMQAAVYPAAVRAVVLGQALTPLVTAAALLGASRELL